MPSCSWCTDFFAQYESCTRAKWDERRTWLKDKFVPTLAIVLNVSTACLALFFLIGILWSYTYQLESFEYVSQSRFAYTFGRDQCGSAALLQARFDNTNTSTGATPGDLSALAFATEDGIAHGYGFGDVGFSRDGQLQDSSGEPIGPVGEIAPSSERLINTQMFISWIYYVMFRLDTRERGLDDSIPIWRYGASALMANVVSYTFRIPQYMAWDGCNWINSASYPQAYIDMAPAIFTAIVLYPVLLMTLVSAKTAKKHRSYGAYKVGVDAWQTAIDEHRYPVILPRWKSFSGWAHVAMTLTLTSLLLFFTLIPAVYLGIYNVTIALENSIEGLVELGFLKFVMQKMGSSRMHFDIFWFAGFVQNLIFIMDVVILAAVVVASTAIEKPEEDEAKKKKSGVCYFLAKSFIAFEMFHFSVKMTMHRTIALFGKIGHRLRMLASRIALVLCAIVLVLFLAGFITTATNDGHSFSFPSASATAHANDTSAGYDLEALAFIDGCNGKYPTAGSVIDYYGMAGPVHEGASCAQSNGTCTEFYDARNNRIGWLKTIGAYDESAVHAIELMAMLTWIALRAVMFKLLNRWGGLVYAVCMFFASIVSFPMKEKVYVLDRSGSCSFIDVPIYPSWLRDMAYFFLILYVAWIALIALGTEFRTHWWGERADVPLMAFWIIFAAVFPPLTVALNSAANGAHEDRSLLSLFISPALIDSGGSNQPSVFLVSSIFVATLFFVDCLIVGFSFSLYCKRHDERVISEVTGKSREAVHKRRFRHRRVSTIRPRRGSVLADGLTICQEFVLACCSPEDETEIVESDVENFYDSDFKLVKLGGASSSSPSAAAMDMEAERE